MKIEIKPGDRQLAFAILLIATIIAIGAVTAYTANANSDSTGVQPAAMGHSANEIDIRPLQIDRTNNRIGIRAPNPQGTLDIGTGANGNPRFQVSQVANSFPRLYMGGSSGAVSYVINKFNPATTGYFGEAADTGGYQFRGSGDFYIQGETGIGTPNPGAELHVYNSAGNVGILIESEDAYSVLNLRNERGGTLTTYGVFSGHPTAGDFTIRENTVDDRLTIQKGTGNIGIGTPPTAEKLDVAGTIHSTGDICTDAGGGECLSTVSGGGSNTLDEAYDEGGAGLGRIINATDGQVEIQGPDGLLVNADVCTNANGGVCLSTVAGGGGTLDDAYDNGRVITADAGAVEIQGTGGLAINSSAEFRLTLDKGVGIPDGGILSIGTIDSGTVLTTAGQGTRLIWYPRKAAFRAGGVWQTQWNEANIGRYSTAFGYDNIASGTYSNAGGQTNTASGDNSFIGAGRANVAGGDNSVISGGGWNTANGLGASVGGGNNNVAAGSYSSIIGGWDNTICAGPNCRYSSILGGYENSIGVPGRFATISGGYSNINTGAFSWAGGVETFAQDQGSFIWQGMNGDMPPQYVTNGAGTFNVRAPGGAFLGGAGWSDVAELMDVLIVDDVQEGEIVSLADYDKLGKSTESYDENLIGVISSSETFTVSLGDVEPLYNDTERLPIALVGKCLVKVSSEAGHIKLGDPITTSSIPGVGMKATRSGKVLGYAMQDYDFPTGGVEEILVFVNIGYYVDEAEFKDMQRRIEQLELAIENR